MVITGCTIQCTTGRFHGGVVDATCKQVILTRRRNQLGDLAASVWWQKSNWKPTRSERGQSREAFLFRCLPQTAYGLTDYRRLAPISFRCVRFHNSNRLVCNLLVVVHTHTLPRQCCIYYSLFSSTRGHGVIVASVATRFCAACSHAGAIFIQLYLYFPSRHLAQGVATLFPLLQAGARDRHLLSGLPCARALPTSWARRWRHI